MIHHKLQLPVSGPEILTFKIDTVNLTKVKKAFRELEKTFEVVYRTELMKKLDPTPFFAQYQEDRKSYSYINQ